MSNYVTNASEEYTQDGPDAMKIAAVIPYYPFHGIPRYPFLVT